jgi:hypothetical protein
MTLAEPRLLRCPDYGLVIEAKVGRVWSQVIARDAREVYVKRIPNAFIQKYAKVVDYPKGIVEAANRFLNPCMGIATVTPAAQTILEAIIMQVYSTKSSAIRGLGRINLGLLDRKEEFIKPTADGKFEVDDVAARAAKKGGKKQAKPAKVVKPKAAAAPRKAKAVAGEEKQPSRKAQARDIFAEHGSDSKKARELITALGVTAATASSWCSEFRRA